MNIRFLICLFLIISVVGCTSQGNKQGNEKVENTVTAPATPKNFERATPPAMMTNPKDRANYLVTHFWDKFNFRDTMYCHVPSITEQAFVDFVYELNNASPAKVSEGIKKMLTNAEEDAVMYEYFFKLGEKYLYHPNSEFRNDEHFVPFLEHIIANPRLTDDHKVRPKHLLELALKNRAGTKASDFSYTLASGNTGRLYSISSKYLLVMFFNPDCFECQRTTDLLKKDESIASSIASGSLKVLAVYPDENLYLWQKHIDKIPSTWINGYDKSLELRNKELYDLKAIPTLYLLDKDKNVIFKDVSVGEISDYLVKNK